MSLFNRLKILERKAAQRRDNVKIAEQLLGQDELARMRSEQEANDTQIGGLPMSHILAREIWRRRVQLEGELPAEKRVQLELELSQLIPRCREERAKDFAEGYIDSEGDATYGWSWKTPDGYGDRFDYGDATSD